MWDILSASLYYTFSLLLSLWVKNIEIRLAFGKVIGENIVAPFPGHGVDVIV